MKILLLSAYDAQSHQYWRTGLVEMFPEYQWQVLTLPARFFSWRVRGNSLSWSYNEQAILSQDYDLVIATSMTDLSALKGLSPHLAKVPSLVYFHENQFAYPLSGKEFSSVEPQILSIYTALSATRVIFNSTYNRDTFLDGAKQLLRKLPDQVPKGLVSMLAEKSSSLAVPLKNIHPVPVNQKIKSHKLEIIWNHRWEYDKGPKLLLLALRALMTRTDNFVIHVVGQHFAQIPEEFSQIKQEFSNKIGTWGYIKEINDYYALLHESDIVLSTALHDFQGLSILQAVQCGCIPLVPNRLAYPEFLPAQYLYSADLGQTELKSEAEVIANELWSYSQMKEKGVLPSRDLVKNCITTIAWKQMKSHYQKVIVDCLAKS